MKEDYNKSHNVNSSKIATLKFIQLYCMLDLAQPNALYFILLKVQYFHILAFIFAWR